MDFYYTQIEYNMYTVHLDTLGIIHDFQWIADIYSIEIISRAISDPAL
jgi:hypothetical protein